MSADRVPYSPAGNSMPLTGLMAQQVVSGQEFTTDNGVTFKSMRTLRGNAGGIGAQNWIEWRRKSVSTWEVGIYEDREWAPFPIIVAAELRRVG